MPEAADSNTDNASAYETCRFSISVYVTVGFAFADQLPRAGWAVSRERLMSLANSGRGYRREGHGRDRRCLSNGLFSGESRNDPLSWLL